MSEITARYSVVHVEDVEGEGPGGMVRKVRRALGAQAFGVNYFRFPPNQTGRQHDHKDSNQEEVYFVIRGSGTMRIGEDEISLRPGTFVRVDPRASRVPSSGADGLEFLAVGAPVGAPYQPPSWG